MDDEHPVEKERKGWWNNTVLIVIVAVVVVFILVTLTFSSALYLLVRSVDDPDYYEEYRTLYLTGEIDATEDQLVLMVISGTVYWADYDVKAENYLHESLYLETLDPSSSAGDIVTFTNVDWDPLPECEYNIKIIDIADNILLWNKNIIADAG